MDEAELDEEESYALGFRVLGQSLGFRVWGFRFWEPTDYASPRSSYGFRKDSVSIVTIVTIVAIVTIRCST